MYYDQKKGRYVIEGEEDSDDDVPPPPPPSFKKKEEVIPDNTNQEGKKEASTAQDLTKPALPGAFANRGRGRGRGGPAIGTRFPQVFNAA